MLAVSVLDELRRVCGQDGVICAPEELLVYECDALTLAKALPDAVVLPRSTEETAEVVRVCAKHDLPMVPRGAGTSLAGGCLAVGGGVMIGTSRLNQILEVDYRNRVARVQAGVVNVHISNRTGPRGYLYAPDPSSQTSCTIGGKIATNSGGPHTLKLGVTANHLLGLTLVTPDGEVLSVGGVGRDPTGYDLTGLIVGSEGTFGIVTEAVISLTRTPEAFRTCLAIFKDLRAAATAVTQIIAAGIVPAALEMMDRNFIRAVEAADHLGLPEDAEALLIVEIDGIDAGLDGQAERVVEICKANDVQSVELAVDSQRRLDLWKGRKRAFGAIGRLAPSYITMDGVVPRSRLPDVLDRIGEIAARHEVSVGNVFHAGDGNVHPILLYDERDGDQTRRVLLASDEILELCVEVGGSVTGEHGIGVEKVKHLAMMFNEDDLDVMGRIRSVFDPAGRCNARKLLPDPEGNIDLLEPAGQPAYA